MLKTAANDTVLGPGCVFLREIRRCRNLQNSSPAKAAAVASGVATKGIYVVKAENSELWDVDGRRYIDFAAGIAVLNTGHRHPRVMAAVAQQAEAFAHTCFHVAPYESYVRLAERLNALAPGRFREEVPVPVGGCGGGRERDQDRALLHQAFGGHRFLRRVSRAHAHDHGAHRQGDALQARLRAVSRRGLSRRISAALPRDHRSSRRCRTWSGCFTAMSTRSPSQPS